MADNKAATHPYTCNTCLVAFKGSELQRGHMQSDWHRYNLKRRVASLPPLSSEIFTEKVLANQATAAATAAKASFERICAPCSRTYYSENAYQNHLGSQKHRVRLLQLEREGPGTESRLDSVTGSTFSLGTPLETLSAVSTVGPGGEHEGVEDEKVKQEFEEVVEGLRKASVVEGEQVPDPMGVEEDPVTRRPSRPHHSAAEEGAPVLTEQANGKETPHTDSSRPAKAGSSLDCLFCGLQFEDIESNVHHMQQRHGMFIPERAYLVDMPGLISWLQERVSVLHECLRCGIVKRTTQGAKTHMRDKGHCMIDFESEEQMIEIGQFYDFSSTYSDDEAEENEATTESIHLGNRQNTKTEVLQTDDDATMQNADDNDEDWESEESDSENLNDSHRTTRNPTTKTAPWEPRPVYHDEDGLHLPSGRTAGHRAFAKYWRQNLRNYPTPEERQERLALTNGSSSDTEMNDDRRVRGRPQNAVTRANGGLGMLGAPESKKKEAQTLELADRKRAQRVQNRYQWGNERRANAQKHFRDPLLQ